MRWIVIVSIALVIFCGSQNRIFLTVGGVDYSIEDFRLYYPEPFKSEEQADSAWYGFLLNKLLVAAARQGEVTNTPPLLQQIPIAKRSTIIKKFFEVEVKDKTPLTKRDYDKAYQELKTDVHISQINFEKRESADKVYKMIQQGWDFDSIVPFCRNPKFFNGDMGYVTFHFLSEATRKQLEKMEIGDISEPFSEFSHWKIIYLKDRIKKDIKPMDEIIPYIKGGLKERKEKQYLKKMIARLRKEYQVRYNQELFRFLFLPPESIPPVRYSEWLVRMKDKEIKLAALHKKLYDMYKEKGFNPREVLDHEIQNEILHQEALKRNYDQRYEREINKAVDDLLATYMYKTNILDSLNISGKEISTYMKKHDDVKNRNIVRKIIRDNKRKKKEKELFIKLKHEIGLKIDSVELSKILIPKEEG